MNARIELHPQAAPSAGPGRRRALRWVLGGLCLPVLGGGAALATWPRGQGDAASLSQSPQPPQDVCRVAPLQSWTPALGPDPLAARLPPPDARCPVCGMYPARQPRWACQLIYRDGAAHFLDAAPDLLRYLQHPARHAPGYGRGDVARVYLPDAGSAEPRWIAAEDATVLVDSAWPAAAASPMRRGALPAFAEADLARQLQARHGGALWSFARLLALPATQWPRSLQGLGPHH